MTTANDLRDILPGKYHHLLDKYLPVIALSYIEDAIETELFVKKNDIYLQKLRQTIRTIRRKMEDGNK